MTFLEKQTNPTVDMHWLGNMQADYLYPNGIGGDRFFKHLLENDTFLAARCPKCNKIFLPPRLFCEDCFCQISNDYWFEIDPIGKIQNFTIVNIDTYGDKLRKPKIIGLIKIDKTDGALIGLIKTKNVEENLDGIKVKAVFKPKNKREGTLKDILYFEKMG